MFKLFYKQKSLVLTLSIIFLISVLVWPDFSFAQPKIEIPKTFEEAKEMVIKALQTVEKEMGGILKKIWEEQVIPVWQKMWELAKGIWEDYLGVKIEALWKWIKAKIQALSGKIQEFLGKEVEKRKPRILEEFEKEREEMGKDISRIINSVWGKIKESILEKLKGFWEGIFK